MPNELLSGLEADELAWVIHRAYGCGPTVGFDAKPGPICEPDWEDRAAADAVRAHLAAVLADAREDVARAMCPGMHIADFDSHESLCEPAAAEVVAVIAARLTLTPTGTEAAADA